MQIIPVIDILNGTVVHAKRGDRANYQPIQSQLCKSSKPLNIVAALLEYCSFEQLYIADLNAIQNIGHDNLAVIKTIARRYPALKLWIDAGVSHISAMTSCNGDNFNVILGSENFSDLDNFLAMKNRLDSNFVLSLDFMPHGYCGPAELIENTDYWPKNVILMSLSQVGANQGPNIELIRKFKHCTNRFNLYAAGGVRNMDDLNLLELTGASGALIASALHHRQLKADELKQMS